MKRFVFIHYFLVLLVVLYIVSMMSSCSPRDTLGITEENRDWKFTEIPFSIERINEGARDDTLRDPGWGGALYYPKQKYKFTSNNIHEGDKIIFSNGQTFTVEGENDYKAKAKIDSVCKADLLTLVQKKCDNLKIDGDKKYKIDRIYSWGITRYTPSAGYSDDHIVLDIIVFLQRYE